MLEDLGSLFTDLGSLFTEPEDFGSLFTEPMPEDLGSDFTGFTDFVDRDPSDSTEDSPPDEIVPPYLGGSRGISRIDRISDFSLGGLDAELIFKHPNLFADAGLRGKQTLRGRRHIEVVMSDFPNISKLL